MLKAHEPYRLATARSNAPKRHAVIEVTNSGKAVENPNSQMPTNESPQPLTAANCRAQFANTGAIRKIIAEPPAKTSIGQYMPLRSVSDCRPVIAARPAAAERDRWRLYRTRVPAIHITSRLKDSGRKR